MTFLGASVLSERGGFAAPGGAGDGVAVAPGRKLVAELLRGIPERMMTDGQWKFIVKEDRAELFNLKKDIGETTDLAKESPDKLKELNDLLDEWEKEMAKTAIPFKKSVKKMRKK